MLVSLGLHHAVWQPSSTSETMLKEAVLLAAGLGNRLRPFTDATPKCLVPAGGVPLLGHLFKSLHENGFTRLIIVTGYEAEQIRGWVESTLRSEKFDLDVVFVHNAHYATTNNIYSLWQVIPHQQEGFVLLESDLIFESSALMALKMPNRMALDWFNPAIQSGTTATVDSRGQVSDMFVREEPPSGLPLYKTVNMTSFSTQTWQQLAARIDDLVKNGVTDTFYELAIRDLIRSGEAAFDIADYSQFWWDEVDTTTDLSRVNSYLGTSQSRWTPESEVSTTGNRAATGHRASVSFDP
jgi:L-glutamine-phosphate cytidylyltransferase